MLYRRYRDATDFEEVVQDVAQNPEEGLFKSCQERGRQIQKPRKMGLRYDSDEEVLMEQPQTMFSSNSARPASCEIREHSRQGRSPASTQGWATGNRRGRPGRGSKVQRGQRWRLRLHEQGFVGERCRLATRPLVGVDCYAHRGMRETMSSRPAYRVSGK